MVFAKISKAASRLSEQIRTRSFGKGYLAVVHKIPKHREGCLEHYLTKNRATNIVQIVEPSTKKGKQAILEYKVLETKDMLSLIYVELLTGRSHQIRVQFSAIGHPLYGDQKYGAEVNKPGQQIALWSNEIKFLHPTTKEEMVFRSQPPANSPWSLFSLSSHVK